MFGSYQRLKVRVAASDITVIRAARKRIAKMHWRNPLMKGQRHQFYRAMLTYHHKMQRTFKANGLL